MASNGMYKGVPRSAIKRRINTRNAMPVMPGNSQAGPKMQKGAVEDMMRKLRPGKQQRWSGFKGFGG